MIKSEFCEKLFENLINHIILQNFNVDIYIPSQNREAKSGIDALFQYGKVKILLLQYKVSYNYKKKPTSFNSCNTFKFNLHKNSRGEYVQHNKLVKNTNKGLLCGYFVPVFNTYKELYNFYHNGLLLSNCRLIIPRSPIKDSKNHFIQYDNSCALQCSSEKKECKMLNFNEKSIDALPEYTKEEFIKFILDKPESDDNIDKALKELEVIVIAIKNV